jgi:hypothetical protein
MLLHSTSKRCVTHHRHTGDAVQLHGRSPPQEPHVLHRSNPAILVCNKVHVLDPTLVHKHVVHACTTRRRRRIEDHKQKATRVHAGEP